MPITPIFCCGFECGIIDAHWTALAGTPSFDATTFNNGLRSLRCNASGSAVVANCLVNDASSLAVWRIYIRFNSALPTGNTFVVYKNAPTLLGLYFQSSDSKLYARVGTTNGASGFSVSAGTWYRIDIKFNQTGGAATTVDVQVDGSALGQASATGSAGVPNTTLGVQAAVTADINFDDAMSSVTSADYPLGAGKVLSFVPAADGTHTFTTTHAILGTTGAPTTGGNITSATTTAFGYVNRRPIGGGVADATRLWNQATAASAEYAEVTIEQTTEAAAPRAVQVLVGVREASSTGCNATYKVNDNGTENTVFAMTSPLGNVDDWETKQYALMPADSAAWTLARFKGLKLRFGYSSDATPDVYCRGWMVEAEFPISAPSTIPHKIFSTMQAVTRSNYY